MKALVDLLHLLLCQQRHVYDMMEYSPRQTGRCYFYLENDIAEGDSMADHLEWDRIKENFKTSLNFKSDEEALKFVKDVITVSQTLKKLTDGCPQKIAFIKTIIT